MNVRCLAVLTSVGLLLAAGCGTRRGNQPKSAPHEPVVLKKNAGWCWYQDERAIITGGKLVFGTVSGTTRDGWARGDIAITSYEIATGRSASFLLAAKFQSDDHDVPALLALPDGRILASFTTHGGHGTEADTHSMYWRITVQPGDISAWGPVRKQDVGGWISYSNLFLLSGENNRIYNFHRCRRDGSSANNPNYMISDDAGQTFRYGGRLLFWPRPKGDPKFTGIDGGRPYVKYASNNVDTIHFVTTEDHPRAYDNSIYHGYLKGGIIYRSDGTEVGPLATGYQAKIRPTDLTRVFQGDAGDVAWTMDLHLDAAGRPYTVFSVQKDGAKERGNRADTHDGQDHRFYYARWDGNKWNTHEMAYAGTRLYPGEDDYTGLATVHPNDPNTVFISTNADPVTGEPLISSADRQRHWEIFRGETADGGQSWNWTPITENSPVDNIRPIVAIWKPGHTALLWLRGTLRAYTDFDLDAMGLIN